jgi:hypothetical protein
MVMLGPGLGWRFGWCFLLDIVEDGRRILGIGPYARIGEVVNGVLSVYL